MSQPINYDTELNNEQLPVILNGNGPCLVLAGAGSGKTRTLVYRVAYLLEHGVSPANILLLTFTNKAADEMLRRVSELLTYRPTGLTGGTFHSVAYNLLRRNGGILGYKPNFNILDEDDSISFLKKCLDGLNVNTRDKSFPSPKVIKNIISLAANVGVPLEKIITDRYAHLRPSITAVLTNAAENYKQQKKSNQVMDFDDLLSNWYELLLASPEVSQALSEQFQYILVDEYQDTNKIQSDIIDRLGTRHRNILAVGDDSQSIYSFRGAVVDNILNFPKRYPEAKIYKLETNYRSTPEILTLANASIKNNDEQFEKKLRTWRQTGTKPTLIIAQDGEAEAQFVVSEVLRQKKEGEKLKNMAVLYRASFQMLELELELNKNNIPYIVSGGLRFFEQAHIKDIIAYLRVLSNPQDEISWQRILSKGEGLGQVTMNKAIAAIKQVGNVEILLLEPLPITLAGKSGESVRSIMNLLKEIFLNKKTTAEAINLILDVSYREYLRNQYDNHKERTEDIEQLANFSGAYASRDEFLAAISLAEGFAGERKNNQKTSSSDYLILSTIHQAKGLEWNTVFVIGLADGQFPHHKSYASGNELCEERRLFYVAVTRAKNLLFLTYPMFSFSKASGTNLNQPSLFIKELPTNLFSTRKLGQTPPPLIARNNFGDQDHHNFDDIANEVSDNQRFLSDYQSDSDSERVIEYN